MKRILLLFFFVSIQAASMLNAQENPIRIGTKLGYPNLAGFSAEYVIPALESKLASTTDFSYISDNNEDISIKITHFAVGANYYFKPNGNGFYAHFGYYMLRYNMDLKLNTDSFWGYFFDQLDGITTFNHLAFRMGGRWGKVFYFRCELGFGVLIGSNHSNINVEVNRTIGEINTNVGLGIAF